MYVHNGKGVHFYLAVDQLTPLLQWMGPDNLTMELHGTTFQNPKTGNQWFRRLVVTQNTSTVLADVSTDHPRFGEQQSSMRADSPSPFTSQRRPSLQRTMSASSRMGT